MCVQQIYSEAKRGFEDNLNTKEKGVVLTKDDKAHGSLLIMNELIRSASIEGEVSNIAVGSSSTEKYMKIIYDNHTIMVHAST